MAEHENFFLQHNSAVARYVLKHEKGAHMTEPFDKDQALAQHIKLSDLHEKKKQEFIAAGFSSTKTSALDMALWELEEEARRNGYVFRCWESDITHGFIHTIERVQEPTLRECPYCHQMHQADLVEQCPLKPKQGNGTIRT